WRSTRTETSPTSSAPTTRGGEDVAGDEGAREGSYAVCHHVPSAIVIHSGKIPPPTQHQTCTRMRESPPARGGLSRCTTSSCPSWDRTRTLLIQSQACCQLHEGAADHKLTFSSENLIPCRAPSLLPGCPPDRCRDLRRPTRCRG